MGSDRGKDFLFSDDCGFINGEAGESYRYSDGSGYYHGADGSEGYIYADGSGYYHGADGSDGYIYSDGSAYYHGADGTDAYKYADGSGYYHGADGSDGYKYSDGSGYYNGAKGSSSRYDSYDNDDENDGYSYSNKRSDDDISFGASLVGLALGLGAVAFVKHTAKAREKARLEEERRLEDQRIDEEKCRERQAKRLKERNIRNKQIKAFLFNKKNLEFEYSTNQLIGTDVEGVVEELKEAGFNNYKTVAIKDIYPGVNKFVGEVEQVVVNGQSWIEAGTMVPYDAEIVITYHLKKEFAFPYPMRLMVKRNYDDLAQELLEIGFTEVYTMPLNDLETGWIKKEFSVQKVLIAGVQTIKKGMLLDHDVKITIQYHSFAKK